jgi:glycine cleavage system protein P-like pyridoxal-binding family
VGATSVLADFLPGPVVIAEEYVIDEDRWEEDEEDDWGNGNHTDDDEAEDEAQDEAEDEAEDGADLWDEADEEELEMEVSEPYFSLYMPPRSIGRVKSFFGQFGMMVRAYTYIRMLGAEGLKQTSLAAVLNANYLQAILKEVLPLPHDRICMHEFVLEGKIEGAPDIRALDIAKRLIDYGIHPPTNYFPLIVPEALMIEPTETESKRTLDIFCETMKKIIQEARENPHLLHDAPVNAPVGRLDEVRAARNLILRWQRGV